MIHQSLQQSTLTKFKSSFRHRIVTSDSSSWNKPWKQTKVNSTIVIFIQPWVDLDQNLPIHSRSNLMLINLFKKIKSWFISSHLWWSMNMSSILKYHNKLYLQHRVLYCTWVIRPSKMLEYFSESFVTSANFSHASSRICWKT